MPPSSELHAQHDPLLVASLAAGDLAGADRDHAAALIDTCVDCAALHTDLVMIARATAALPSAVAPRDFRLTPEQAAALRPRGWRRLIAAIGESRPLMSRQLGIGLATIGLAGLLVSTLPGIQFGSETSTTPLAADFECPPIGHGSRRAEWRERPRGRRITRGARCGSREWQPFVPQRPAGADLVRHGGRRDSRRHSGRNGDAGFGGGRRNLRCRPRRPDSHGWPHD